MWSKGKTPFSGGTGLSPLFPPNAPPAKKKLQTFKEKWKNTYTTAVTGRIFTG